MLPTLKTSDIEISQIANDQIALSDFIQKLRTQSAVLGAGFHFPAVNELSGLQIHDQIEFRPCGGAALIGNGAVVSRVFPIHPELSGILHQDPSETHLAKAIHFSIDQQRGQYGIEKAHRLLMEALVERLTRETRPWVSIQL